jgi:hypothetical protein
MSPVDARVRVWARAPADGFVEQFADDGPFGGLTQWVRAASPALDLHLWSDPSAAMHRARVVAGTVGLIDLVWSPHRFQIAARRPFTRIPGGWLDDAWYPTKAAGERVRRAVAFGEVARDLAASRAEFGIAALSRLDVVTQEYSPLLAGPLEATPEVAGIRRALDPSPISGGEPFFAAAPDAVALGADGVVEFVRVYSARAPELRFAAAQAVADLGLFAALDPAERRRQLRHFDLVVAARTRLGLPTSSGSAVGGPARARILASADLSPRLHEQYRSVRARLVEHGLLDDGALRMDVVEDAAPGSRAAESVA